MIVHTSEEVVKPHPKGEHGHHVTYQVQSVCKTERFAVGQHGIFDDLDHFGHIVRKVKGTIERLRRHNGHIHGVVRLDTPQGSIASRIVMLE